MKPSSSSTLARATLSFVAGISTNGRSIVVGVADAGEHVRDRVGHHGCVLPFRGYQDALRTPGISPSLASLRKQIRQTPNLRYTARPRPQIWHRRQNADHVAGPASTWPGPAGRRASSARRGGRRAPPAGGGAWLLWRWLTSRVLSVRRTGSDSGLHAPREPAVPVSASSESGVSQNQDIDSGSC